MIGGYTNHEKIVDTLPTKHYTWKHGIGKPCHNIQKVKHMIFEIHDIDYDLDDDFEDQQSPDLPQTLIVEISNHATELCSISEILSDYISDVTGFCHNGFNYHQLG